MRERDTIPDNDDRYWTDDLLLGEIPLWGETSTVRLRLHVSEEPYRSRAAADIVPLAHPSGLATYVHGRPYVHEPEISLTVGLYPMPSEAGTIGEVLGADWVGMRQREIGNAQAWYYPGDRLLVLWEMYLHDWCRRENPVTDPALATVWTGFERVLVERFPQTQRIVTPSWEDLYAKVDWQQFLAGQGYQPHGPRAFARELMTAGV
jgi:hypothetical protein